MSSEHHYQEEKGIHEPHSTTKEIWMAFWILLGLTVLEFSIAFSPEGFQALLGGRTGVIIIFLILTIFKAFYIIAYFMHLKHEKINLVYTIVVPFIFIIFMVALLLYEGASLLPF